jgi:hypothetical protein
MAFSASPAQILERLERVVEADLDRNWAAEPLSARAALLTREELDRWTRDAYPGCSSEGAALDPGSRRRLSLLIHSAPVSHRVEVWGSADGDEAPPAVSGHTSHSWVVVAHVGQAGRALDAAGSRLEAAGLKRVAERRSGRLAFALWMGSAAPDGCPDCLGKAP